MYSHILVVDDDREMRRLLRDYLGKHYHRVTCVPDGQAMRECMAERPVDLLLLDIMLGRDDGFELCREVRSACNTPIIMLTARGDSEDKIVGLELGADDYVSKPFTPRELLARVQAVLRRASHPTGRGGHSTSGYRFAAWTLDLQTKNLTDAAGVVTPLSGSEYRMLSKLLSARRRVLTRAQLADGGARRAHNPLDRGIDVCISRLRQILREPDIIKTVYGEGYSIGVDVASF